MNLFFVLLAATLVSARPHFPARARSDVVSDPDVVSKPLPSSWYQHDEHPVHNLFRRATTDGVAYPEVGSPAWSAGYPTRIPDPRQLPRAWVDALNAAVAAGRIPDIPVARSNGDENPTYPDGFDPAGPTVCSATYQCRIPGDIWDGPDGTFGANFDDGPLPPVTTLNQFLQQNNVRATHFMIGVNILQNPALFTQTLQLNHDIAVHTWTHPYMTTLNNMQVLGEIGWTMQIIHNSTGGRLPRYWRPPYGDSDVRVSAIARQVFGLQTVIWNHDTDDWTLTDPNTSEGGTTLAKISSSMNTWLTGPKSPGLIVLEHEVSDQSVQAFINAFPSIQQNGWRIDSLATLLSGTPYQNVDASGTVFPAIVGGGNVSVLPSVLPPSVLPTTTPLPPTLQPTLTPAPPLSPVSGLRSEARPQLSLSLAQSLLMLSGSLVLLVV